MSVEESEAKDKILIVDDEQEVLEILGKILEGADRLDCEVDTAKNGEEALEKLEEQFYHLVLADHKMPGITGVELLTQVKEKYPRTVRILITGYSDVTIAKDAINKAEVHYYLEKPWDDDEIIETVERELERRKQRESKRVMKPENVMEAIEMVENLRDKFKSVSTSHPGIVSIPDEKKEGRYNMVLEFDSSDKFNKFSYELKHDSELTEVHKVRIEDVQVFNNRYIVTVSMKP